MALQKTYRHRRADGSKKEDSLICLTKKYYNRHPKHLEGSMFDATTKHLPERLDVNPQEFATWSLLDGFAYNNMFLQAKSENCKYAKCMTIEHFMAIQLDTMVRKGMYEDTWAFHIKIIHTHESAYKHVNWARLLTSLHPEGEMEKEEGEYSVELKALFQKDIHINLLRHLNTLLKAHGHNIINYMLLHRLELLEPLVNKIIKLLVEDGARETADNEYRVSRDWNLNVVHPDSNTTLLNVLRNNIPDLPIALVKYMSKKGISTINNVGDNALLIALHSYTQHNPETYEEFAKKLVRKTNNVNHCNNSGMSALWIAIENKNQVFLELLLINRVGMASIRDHRTPFMAIIESFGNIEHIRGYYHPGECCLKHDYNSRNAFTTLFDWVMDWKIMTGFADPWDVVDEEQNPTQHMQEFMEWARPIIPTLPSAMVEGILRRAHNAFKQHPEYFKFDFFKYFKHHTNFDRIMVRINRD